MAGRSVREGILLGTCRQRQDESGFRVCREVYWTRTPGDLDDDRITNLPRRPLDEDPNIAGQ